MSNHSIIEHRASYYYIRIEEDFLAICCNGKCSPHCKALILAILEHWINTKRARGEGNYVYLTMPQWIQHMYMLYERNVIENCIHELLEEGLIKRRPIKLHGQKTFEYTLDVDAIHKRIKLLPPKLQNDTLPNLDEYIGYKEKAKEERKKVREKSPTSEVREKSQKVREKSQRVREKSPTGYVKNHSNIESNTEIHNIDSTERMNDDSQQNTNVSTTQEASHSSIPASLSSQKTSSSQSEEEVSLTETEQMIYEYACQTIFKAKPPRKTPKLKSECAELAKHVKTAEQFTNLVQYVKALPYIQGQIHLKNLVNELNGWIQSLEAKPTQASSSRGKPTGPHIAHQPTKSQEQIDRENAEQLAKFHARIAARKQAQQEGAKA